MQAHLGEKKCLGTYDDAITIRPKRISKQQTRSNMGVAANNFMVTINRPLPTTVEHRSPLMGNVGEGPIPYQSCHVRQPRAACHHVPQKATRQRETPGQVVR